MGNCICGRHDRSQQTEWGGDDWGATLQPMSGSDEEDDRFRSSSKSSSKTAAAVTEVKVKITKKQLGEMLGKVDVQGMTVQQVLVQLMNVSAKYEAHELRSWRPRLQTIHERSDSFDSSS